MGEEGVVYGECGSGFLLFVVFEKGVVTGRVEVFVLAFMPSSFLNHVIPSSSRDLAFGITGGIFVVICLRGFRCVLGELSIRNDLEDSCCPEVTSVAGSNLFCLLSCLNKITLSWGNSFANDPFSLGFTIYRG